MAVPGFDSLTAACPLLPGDPELPMSVSDTDLYAVESADQIAGTRARTYGPDGGIVPGRCAGYVYDGAAFCPECASGIDVPTADGETSKMDHYPAYDDDGRTITDGRGFGVGVLSGLDEWDAPGASCDVCHRRLQTNIIHY